MDYSRKTMTVEALRMLRLAPPNLGMHDQIMVSCPFHKDKSPSMTISLSKGIYHCFSCSRSGNIEGLFWDLTHSSLKKTLGMADDPFSNYSFNYIPVEYNDDPMELKETNIEYDHKNIEDAWDNLDCRNYLIKRGISKESSKSMGFKYTSYNKFNGVKYEKRLLIPVYEEGHLLSVEGRRITDDKNTPKVLYPRGSTTQTLFDIDNLRTDKTLFALEGLMDLAVLRGCSVFKNSTSIFGASLTRRQIELLKRFQDNGIVYINDRDRAGENTIKILQESGLRNVRVLSPPKELCGREIKDIGDLPKVGWNVDMLVDRNWFSYLVDLKDYRFLYQEE